MAESLQTYFYDLDSMAMLARSKFVYISLARPSLPKNYVEWTSFLKYLWESEPFVFLAAVLDLH